MIVGESNVLVLSRSSLWHPTGTLLPLYLESTDRNCYGTGKDGNYYPEGIIRLRK